MVASHNHAVLLRGLRLHEAGDSRPTLVRRSDIKFLDGLLADMSEGGSFAKLTAGTINQGMARNQLAARPVERADRMVLRRTKRELQPPVKLYQPVHRTFQFVVLEAVCDFLPELGEAGLPKLDRTQIESSGLVIRRINGETGLTEAWLSDGNALRGWFPIQEDGLNDDIDPDPQRRPRRLGTGIRELDEQLGLHRIPAEHLSEAVEPLYVAPPDVCAGAARTLLFGMIPTVSLEQSELPTAQLAPPRLEIGQLRDLFADYLTPAGGQRLIPLQLNPLGVDFYQLKQRELTQQDRFLSLLRWVVELDALENPAVIEHLNGITVQLGLDPTTPGLAIVAPFTRITQRGQNNQVIADYLEVRLGDLVADAATRLRDSEIDLTNQITVASGQTLAWSIPTTTLSDEVLGALADRMQSRITEFKLISGERRFDPRRGRYVARAFIRVKREPGCPPQLWWSEYSEVFQIAQHWDHNPDVPPAIIPLPDLPSRAALKAMKPNVAFEVPESLENFLAANGLNAFLEGNATKGNGGGIGILWICSFSIYIIMMIAFIILIIFAILLNIVFNWLIFIRICLPIPVPEEE